MTKRKYKIVWIQSCEFSRAQRGVICKMWVLMNTPAQYTDECVFVSDSALGHSPLSYLLAFLRAKKQGRVAFRDRVRNLIHGV